MNLFLASSLTAGEQQPMEDERIEIAWVTRKQIPDMIRAGKLEDGKTLIGYFMWLNTLAKKTTRS
jgi:ADP-ribose pyrophosphatase